MINYRELYENHKIKDGCREPEMNESSIVYSYIDKDGQCLDHNYEGDVIDIICVTCDKVLYKAR